ncbi:Uncharacterised protein [Corynebacterium imitans]|uniref:Uncharacterized protein n=1 Tax=Corynebacterium imitans TaxID=156978 RepID=A0A239YBE5_9CORY|nr:Uncharacterised protein [Corynebacterium imitans]
MLSHTYDGLMTVILVAALPLALGMFTMGMERLEAVAVNPEAPSE